MPYIPYDSLTPEAPISADPGMAPEPVAAPDPDGAFGRAMLRGVDQTQAMAYSTAEALGQATGINMLEQWGTDGVERNVQEILANPPVIRTWDDIDSLSEAGTYFLEVLGEQALQIVPALVAARVGAGAGAAAAKLAVTASIGKALKRKIGEQAFKTLRKNAAKSGALTAAGATVLAQTVGETQMELSAEGVEAPGTAFTVGAAKAGFELFGLHKLFGLAKRVGRSPTELVTEVAKVIGIEAGTEGLQTIADKLAVASEVPDFDPFSPEALAEIKESMIRGGIVGGVGRTATGGYQMATAPKEPGVDKDNPSAESQQVIDAQYATILDPTSTKNVMEVTQGSPMPTHLSPNAEVVKTQNGVAITFDMDIASQINSIGGTEAQMGELLYGKPKGKEGSDGTGVVARDADGTPVAEIAGNAESFSDDYDTAAGLAPEGGSVEATNGVAVVQERAERVAAEQTAQAPQTVEEFLAAGGTIEQVPAAEDTPEVSGIGEVDDGRTLEATDVYDVDLNNAIEAGDPVSEEFVGPVPILSDEATLDMAADYANAQALFETDVPVTPEATVEETNFFNQAEELTLAAKAEDPSQRTATRILPEGSGYQATVAPAIFDSVQAAEDYAQNVRSRTPDRYVGVRAETDGWRVFTEELPTALAPDSNVIAKGRSMPVAQRVREGIVEARRRAGEIARKVGTNKLPAATLDQVITLVDPSGKRINMQTMAITTMGMDLNKNTADATKYSEHETAASGYLTGLAELMSRGFTTTDQRATSPLTPVYVTASGAKNLGQLREGVNAEVGAVQGIAQKERRVEAGNRAVRNLAESLDPADTDKIKLYEEKIEELRDDIKREKKALNRSERGGKDGRVDPAEDSDTPGVPGDVDKARILGEEVTVAEVEEQRRKDGADEDPDGDRRADIQFRRQMGYNRRYGAPTTEREVARRDAAVGKPAAKKPAAKKPAAKKPAAKKPAAKARPIELPPAKQPTEAINGQVQEGVADARRKAGIIDGRVKAARLPAAALDQIIEVTAPNGDRIRVQTAPITAMGMEINGSTPGGSMQNEYKAAADGYLTGLSEMAARGYEIPGPATAPQTPVYITDSGPVTLGQLLGVETQTKKPAAEAPAATETPPPASADNGGTPPRPPAPPTTPVGPTSGDVFPGTRLTRAVREVNRMYRASMRSSIGSFLFSSHGQLKQISPKLAAMIYQDTNTAGTHALWTGIGDARTKWRGLLTRIARTDSDNPKADMADFTALAQELPDAELTPRARAIRRFLNRYHTEYLSPALPTLGKIKNFFPRLYDTFHIEQNKSEFEDILRRHGVENAPQVSDSIISSHTSEGIHENKAYMPQTTSILKQRHLTDPALIRDLVDAGFLNVNPAQTLYSYINSTAKRAEWEKRFGGYTEVEGYTPPKEIAEMAEGLRSSPQRGNATTIRRLALQSATYPDLYLRDQYTEARSLAKAAMAASRLDPSDVELAAKADRLDRLHLSSWRFRLWKIIRATRDRMLATGVLRYTDGPGSRLELYDANVRMKEAIDGDPDVLPAEYPRVRRLIMAAVESAPVDRTTWHYQALGQLRAYESLRVLLMSGVASIPEIGSIYARANGEIGVKQYAAILKDTAVHYKDRRDLAEDLGIIEHGAGVAMMQEMFGPGVGEKGSAKYDPRNLLPYMFKYNGNNAIVNFTKAVSAETGKVFLQRVAPQAAAGDARSQRYLEALGITAEEANQWAGDNFAHPEDLTGEAAIAAQKGETAVSRFSRESVLEPTPADRPPWSSHPLGALVMHLKSFMYTFFRKVVLGMGRELHQRHTLQDATRMQTLAFAGSAVGLFLFLGGISDELRNRMLSMGEYGTFGANYNDPGRMAAKWVSRSGLTALPFSDAFPGMEPDDIAFAAGPTFSHFYTMLFKDLPGDKDAVKKAVQAVPIASQVPLIRRQFYDFLEQSDAVPPSGFGG